MPDKNHLSVDALGNLLRFRLTAGQRHDITQAEALIADYTFECLIADRSYDADEFLYLPVDKPAEAVNPPRRNRKAPRDYDLHLYKERHLVECLINKFKQYRRIFPALTNWISATWAFYVWLAHSSGYAEMSTLPSYY